LNLDRLYFSEQWKFLHRRREGWDEHLERVRAFLGEGLRKAPAGRPVPVLGAGTGLEVPWSQGKEGVVGWDADPWSRVGTLLRHGRWIPWVREDLTGGMGDLAALVERNVRQPWSGKDRDPRKVRARLAGLLDTLRPGAGPLRRWIAASDPPVILSANVMGQFGPVAQRVLEQGFRRGTPWEEDPDVPDPLAVALDAWTRRALQAFLAALGSGGAELWMVHDRGVVHGRAPESLAPGPGPWTSRLRGVGPFEVSDPLCGLEVPGALGRAPEREEHWLWPLGPGQTHVMEALHFPPAPYEQGCGHGRGSRS
jgi:hypothetical protein